jgi:hypothetical protein
VAIDDSDEFMPSDPFKDIDGPYIATFTGRIPFLLGVPDHLGHHISFPEVFADPSAKTTFKSDPRVNIRVFRVETPGIPMRTPGADQALKRFYNYEIPQGLSDRFAEENLSDFEQWVSLETQGAITKGEDPADKGFTFHRCLTIFNLFIRAVMIATHDFRLRTVVAQDFRPAIVIGAIPLKGGEWRNVSDMMVFPDFPSKIAMVNKPPFSGEQLNEGIKSVEHNAPFVQALLWRGQATDAMKRTGDAAAAVVGLQTAVESLLFDTYRMLLVDEGRTKQEIDAELAIEPAFATLTKTWLKDKLGGNWDPALTSTPFGEYWEKLYQVRNDTVHRGIQPHFGHAEDANKAYESLFEFIATQLQVKCHTYPRTLLAFLGEQGLKERGWLSNWMGVFIADAKTEPGPFFHPWDEAGRLSPLV